MGIIIVEEKEPYFKEEEFDKFCIDFHWHNWQKVDKNYKVFLPRSDLMAMLYEMGLLNAINSLGLEKPGHNDKYSDSKYSRGEVVRFFVQNLNIFAERGFFKWLKNTDGLLTLWCKDGHTSGKFSIKSLSYIDKEGRQHSTNWDERVESTIFWELHSKLAPMGLDATKMCELMQEVKVVSERHMLNKSVNKSDGDKASEINGTDSNSLNKSGQNKI